MARILAVDDSSEQLLAIEMFLPGDEFDVATAQGGTEALELCAQNDFDLVLLDVRMPGMDGFEVCRRLKADHRTATTPVIFLTGHIASETAQQEAYALGAVDYVLKPVRREELVARIRVMLRLQEVRNRLAIENVRLGDALATTVRELEELRAKASTLSELAGTASGQQVGVALIDRAGVVRGADPVATALLPGLRIGAHVDGLAVGARLRPLLDAGRGGADVVVDGEPRRIDVAPTGGEPTVVLVRDAAVERQLRDRLERREEAVTEPRERASGYSIQGMIGSSPALSPVVEMVDQLRRSRSTVLIHGESGCGKELIARALHFDGPRPARPFIPIHCGAISRDLIESELFGYEKGAFTGAQGRRDGLFAAADGGTIFLDEIAETSLELQVKLLRVLQLGEIRPIGSTQFRFVDVRVVAATHQDLHQLVQLGRFREDLYFRLQVVTIELPPLRERIDDLPDLLDHFLAVGNERFGRGQQPVRGVSRAALRRMQAYAWPGNVRELGNVVERAFALGVGELLQEEDLPAHVRAASSPLTAGVVDVAPQVAAPQVFDLRLLREASDRSAFVRALQDSEGDKLAAARALGLPRSTFYRRLKELGL